ncbi:Bardet-Biedl syndrome 7 protein [Orchesella cincta]|uniref:Bardet-Biedl syndrome 7 protein n=1 Tax=Orchesella cincta TaxID=48709 RepID=A0A1D2MSA2_ORCCI|nr:Bardet-Biedl syndrome 7 protein [Orchesella cincta]
MNLLSLVIANREGNIQIVGWNKVEAVYQCKIPLSQAISALQLGGAVAKDKIFVAAGNIVRGFTKKGKLFLEFDTNLAEPIKCMHVMGGHLLVAGMNVFSQYEDCQDAGYYVSDDEITSVIALPIEKVRKLMPILACTDRTLKVLNSAQLDFSVNIDGIPTCLHLMFGDGGELGTDLLYGTSDGKLCLISILSSEGYLRWTLESDANAGVTCMDFFDLTSDGNKELITGFDDGTIHVYAIDPENYQSVSPRLIFSHCCNESITGVQGGIFGHDGFEEVIVVTYSVMVSALLGWVFGLTTETTDKKIRVDDGNFSISEDTRQKLIRLKNEIEELQAKVVQERDKYQSATQGNQGGYSAVPVFAMNEKFVLNREDASYLLTLEVESPIDTILIQSDVPVDLLDVEKNAAVVSFSQCDPDSGNYLLVTFRCQANTTRIEVRLRTIEGQQGTIQAYVTPRIQPKSCQVRSFTIKPLSLHVRCHAFDPNRPYNTLQLKGHFSVAEMHSWLSNCIPEMPERAPASGEANLTFVSSFLDTLLHCAYSKGEAEFKSDNVSTISILKDCISKEATKKKIQLEIDCDFNEESVLHTLQLIRPKLDGFLTLSKQVSLIDVLKEIQAHDPDVANVLTPEYRHILTNADKLRATHKRQPSYLDRLYGMITDLYIDKHKYNGINVKSKVPMLMEVLDRHDFNVLVDFFQTPAHALGGPGSAHSHHSHHHHNQHLGSY